MHLGIAGAGLMGRVLAWHLLAAGHRVTLFDRDPVASGGAAAYTAAGMLAPWSELESAESLIFRLGCRALSLWPTLVASLGTDVDFHTGGSLLVAHGADRGDYRRTVEHIAARLPVGREDSLRELDRSELRSLEPALADTFDEALWLPDEAWLDSRRLMAALGDHLLAAGAHWHPETEVQSLAPGVIKTAGRDWHFDWVVDCRGLGARGDMAGLRGVRGEVLWLQAPDVELSRPVRLMHPRYRLYAVPRRDNLYVIGATQIESDDHGPVTVRSCLELLSAAYSLHPGFQEARLIHAEANCRPALDDNLPRIDIGDGLARINGLFRHGYLLAPALAEHFCRRLAGEETGTALFDNICFDRSGFDRNGFDKSDDQSIRVANHD